MTLGVMIDVSAPVETYDAMHAALLERSGSARPSTGCSCT